MKNKKRSKGKRLREILSILRKRKIHKGLTPEKLRLILEDLGPTFMKLGQIASTREDVIPAEYCLELSKLRTLTTPVPAFEIRRIIENKCGAKMDQLFLSFDNDPIGAATIAQVHNAVLKDGRLVVVKVQRPGIYEIMENDVCLLLKAAGIINRTKMAKGLIDLKMLLHEIWLVTQQEMDFETEAKNLLEFARLNADISYVSCPAVFPKYANKYVLVMERVDGISIDQVEALVNKGYDIKDLSFKLTANYVKQILEDGYFHGDPHPGNIIIREGQIIWIDMGMMGRLSERDRVLIKKAMYAIIEQDILSLKEVLLSLGKHTGRINHALLYTDIENYLNKYASMSLGEATNINIAQIMDEMIATARTHGIAVPSGITMLGRGMILLESLLLRLNPDMDLVTVLANHLKAPLLKTVDFEQLLSDSGRSIFVSLKKSMDLPAQLSDLMKMTIKGQTKINYEFSGSEDFNKHLSLQVNKIVCAFLGSALFIGSSIFCNLPYTWTILEIPAPAFIGFVLSVVFIVRLLFLSGKNE